MEDDPIKIARLQVEMENVKEVLKELVLKVDRFTESVKAENSRWATKEDLQRIEAKTNRFLWLSNLFTAVAVSVVTFLVIDFLQNK